MRTFATLLSFEWTEALRSNFSNLTSLEIWVHLFDSNRDHTVFFHTAMESCPKLTVLHFMCTNSFTSKPLKQLVSGLHHLPNTKRFSLTKGLDENMLETVIRIVKQVPKMKQISVRWARERCANHLKQEGIYDVVHEDVTGTPCALVVLERGISFVGGTFCRQYRHALSLAPGDWQRSVTQSTKVVRKRVSSMPSIKGVRS